MTQTVESNEIAERNTGTQVAESQNGQHADPMLAMIERVATNPEADVSKLREMLDMKREIFERNAEIEFNRSMSLAQSEILPVARDAQNDQTKSSYAKLESIVKKASPIYTKYGFALSFGTDDSPREGWFRVTCVASHSDGHSKHYHIDVPPDATGIAGKVNKTPIHAMGSSMSYARRYLTCMIFNIVLGDEDDDGQAAGQQPQQNTITRDQTMHLMDLIQKAKATPEEFCKKVRVNAVHELQANRFAGAEKLLKDRIVKIQGAQQ